MPVSNPVKYNSSVSKTIKSKPCLVKELNKRSTNKENYDGKMKKNKGKKNKSITKSNRTDKGCGKNKLKCMYFNARSIVNKHEELELYINDEDIDIIGITETWLNSEISDSEINLDGYTIFRKDRDHANKTRGGGVALYVRSELSCVRRDDIVEVNFPETLWCNIDSNKESTLIGVCYRAPDSLQLQDEALYSLLGKVSLEQNVTIMGDFNFRELNWGNLETIDESHLFIECLRDNFLSQLVNQPTRSNNYLDLILSSDENIVENVNVGEPFKTSDHQIIRFSLITRKPVQNKVTQTFNYYTDSYDEVRKYVQSLQLSEIIDYSNVEGMWDKLKVNLTETRNKFIPLHKKLKRKCKWVTKKATRCRLAKKKAWNKYANNKKDKNLYEVYKRKLNISNRENNLAKHSFEEQLANNIKNDSKSFYAYVRSKQRSKTRVGPLKDDSGEIVTDNLVASNLLNNYFASVFTIENLQNIPEPIKVFKGKQEDFLSDIVINEEIVKRKLDMINVNKSQGPDGIHPKLLYELREELALPLTKLFKQSLKLGVIPQDWRDANVAPIHKKGSKDKAENYRPVSLTSVIGKILEGIVKEHIVMHLDKYSLLNTTQHGFTSGRSCLSNLLVFLEHVTKELDEGNAVDLVYLDFAKAFDKVPYCRLFKKLEAHGVGGFILNWVKSWLSNRRQHVCIEGESSNWMDVTSGVPQGSVLGPVLFLIYINDLESNLVGKVSKFADDTKLCKGIKTDDDVECLRKDLDNLSLWSEDWQMKFNTEKCSVIHLGRKNEKQDYHLCDKKLRASNKERDLGIITDENLNFSEQCNNAVRNANVILGMIKRTIQNKSKQIVIKLYKSLVRPKLEYCVQAWRPYLRKDIDKIEKVQHRATKMISDIKKLSYHDRLHATNLITLEDRRIRGDLIETFKMLKGISNVDYREFFRLVEYRKTRGHMLKLEKVRSRTNIRKYFFSQRIVNTWNRLPESVVTAETVNSFKNRYDSYMSKIGR